MSGGLLLPPAAFSAPTHDTTSYRPSTACRAAHTDAAQQNANALLDDHAEAASDDAEDQPDDQLGAEELSELDEEDYLDDDDDDFQGSETSAGAMVDIADTDWGAKALLVAQQVLQHSDMRELELFSLMASPSRKQLKIRLDKPEDEYGSPSLDEIAVFSRLFSDEYHKAMGEAAEDVAVEVSSPGAERQVRVPRDLERFQHLPMLVTFQLQDSEKTDTKVMELVAYHEADATAEWKLADVRQNRSGKGVSKLSKKQAGQRWTVALPAHLKINLHLEV